MNDVVLELVQTEPPTATTKQGGWGDSGGRRCLILRYTSASSLRPFTQRQPMSCGLPVTVDWALGALQVGVILSYREYKNFTNDVRSLDFQGNFVAREMTEMSWALV